MPSKNFSIITNDILQNWMKNDPHLVILDSSFTLPGTSPSASTVYKEKRIPGARWFDVDSIKDPSSPLPHMMPSGRIFREACEALGISQSSKIVVYGQSTVAMGPCRALWMLKQFGHKDVHLLNGSLNHWESSGLTIETEEPNPVEATSYDWVAAPDRLARIDDIRSAISDNTTLILDARAPERFEGLAPEPRAGLRSGHMPGARNLPASQLVNTETGGFLDVGTLKERFESVGAETGRKTITTCGSGITACTLDLAISLTGLGENRVYDGSWSEWGQSSLDTPVETGASSEPLKA